MQTRRKLFLVVLVLVALMGLTWSELAAQAPTPVVGDPVVATPTPSPELGEEIETVTPPGEPPMIWGVVCRKIVFFLPVPHCDYPLVVRAIYNAQVKMRNEDGSYTARLFTDREGRYVADELWAGQYSVWTWRVDGCEGKFYNIDIILRDVDNGVVIRRDFVCATYPSFLPRIFR